MTTQPLSNVGLKPSGFQFTVARYPTIDFPVQSVTIPSVSMNAAIQNTPQMTIKWPGEKLQYPRFPIRFMLNSDLSNYITLFAWMRQNASPQVPLPTDFASSMLAYAQSTSGDDGQNYFSELNLILLNNNNNPTVNFTFIDAFPVGLGSITMDTTINGEEYLYVDCEFEYTSFNVNGV